jgi:class 3 adenylate cyclase
MSDTNLVRRLTTIIAIDVVAFSTMSARDEEHALALLGARMDIAGTLIRHHRGRVFKLTGDGLLAEFASPVEAVRAALEIQEAMRSANATSGENDQLNLRIGINLGDIVESGDDLMGDAVNVAVRLESIATTGGICVSSSVYEQITGKLMLGAEDIGDQHVKNIPRPIHAYRLTLDGSKPTPPHPAHEAAKASPRSRVLLVGGIVTALAIAAIGGTFYLRQGPTSGAAQTAQPTSATLVPTPPTSVAAVPPAASATTPAATPPPAAPAAPQPRSFVPKEVPFVPDFRSRALENYASAADSKAFALNVRGIFAMATRRIDDVTARRVALEECNKAVQRDVPVMRDYDRCMIYAVGNDVVWSFRSPAMPPPPYVPAARPNPPIPFDPATAPLINAPARKNLEEHYLKSDRSRALVLGHNRFDWWTPSQNDQDAIRRNLQICGHLTGRPCVVYALNNETLVRTPQTMRPVNVLIPQDIGNITPDQRQALDKYLIANDWRAVALSSNGRVGIVSGKASESEATAEALRICTQSGGMDCAINSIGPFRVAPN